MLFGAVRIVLMSRIFTGAVPRTACAYAAFNFGTSASARECPGGTRAAPPASDIEVIASRRFMVFSP